MGAIPYAARIWSGERPDHSPSTAGSVVSRHQGPAGPVRVGVPPSYGGPLVFAFDSRRRIGGPGCAAEECADTTSRMPATVSTLPDMPFGSFGVFTGRATISPEDSL